MVYRRYRAPVGTVSLPANTIIGSLQASEVQISESIDINSLKLTGMLANEVEAVEWTAVSAANDTS